MLGSRSGDCGRCGGLRCSFVSSPALVRGVRFCCRVFCLRVCRCYCFTRGVALWDDGSPGQPRRQAAARKDQDREERAAASRTIPPRTQRRCYGLSSDSCACVLASPLPVGLRFGWTATLTARFKKKKPITFTNAQSHLQLLLCGMEGVTYTWALGPRSAF